jgi:nitrogen fixation/metabolism regulation signal transduction histidine kinase
MNSKSFRFSVLWRLTLIGATMFLLIYLALKGNYWASCFGLTILLIVQVWRIIKVIERTHHELNNFFQALIYNDNTQRFFVSSGTVVNTELARAFDTIQTRIQILTQAHQEQLHYYSLLLERVPTALVVFDKDESLHMINTAAQQLFQRVIFADAQSIHGYGEHFSQALRNIAPGEKRTTSLIVNSNVCAVVLTAAILHLAGNEKKVVTIHPIQQELDMREIQAWQNLVQVFTHEIMNSMTPVASLSQTASDLLSELEQELQHIDTHEKITDASQAIGTLARRADHLMKFVQAYQRIANPPHLQKSAAAIESIFTEIAQLFKEVAQRQKAVITWQVLPAKLSFILDRVQVEQVLINLVKNAFEALSDHPAGEIYLSAYIGEDGNLLIDVSDNGQGIQAEKQEKIFVPFYTTKAEGSGIGLFLVKQIMQAHHGNVRALAREEGGATFRLRFS